MKTPALLILCCLLFLCFSCNKKQSKSDEANASTDNIVDTVKQKDPKNKDCDDFLDQYEKWMDDLVTLMGNYKDNPVGLATSPEYINTMSEGITWATDWMQQPMTCVNSKTYQKRFEAIQSKAEKKMEELGLK